MPTPDRIDITVDYMIDISMADRIATRVRAAIHNNVQHIVLNLEPGVEIASAEFISFLSATKTILQAEDRKISIVGGGSKTRALLRIAKLEQLIQTAEQGDA